MNYHIVQADLSRQDNVDKIISSLGPQRIDCESIHYKDIELFYKKNPLFKVTGSRIDVSEVGCFASHYKAWSYVLDNDLDNLLVLEDDALIKDNFADEINQFIKFLPKDFDVFFIYYDYEMSKRFQFKRDYIGNDFVCKAFQDWSTLCYLISNSGAKKLLELTHEYGMTRPVDRVMLDLGKSEIIKAYAPKPPRYVNILINKEYKTMIRRGNE